MAIRCWCLKCKFNKGGWCELGYIEVDENRVCQEYEPKEGNGELTWEEIERKIKELPVEKVSSEEYEEIIRETKEVLEGKVNGLTINEVLKMLKER